MGKYETFTEKDMETGSEVFAPLMEAVYTSPSRTFKRVEDINEVKRTSGATDHVWLVFTNKITWPGPEYHLQGGPAEIPARLGIRGIPIEDIKVDIQEAFKLALDKLHQMNCGDQFIGNINLYWPLTAPGLNPEPCYMFTVSCYTLITVGAFSGNVHVN